MKNECEVIKDLLPSYIAGILNIKTEEAIKEHIDNCSNCKKIFEEMKINGINNPNIQDEKIEIDYLKKYNRKMKLLKVLLVSIILILIIFSSVCIIKYNYNINIMKSVSNNIEGIQAENNYSITITEHRIDYENKREFTAITEHYYKDNNYKTREFCEKASFDVTNKDTYYYGEINTENRIKIVEDTKMAYKESSNYVYVKKGAFLRELKNAIEIFDVDLGYFNNIFMKGRYQVRMDRYNGKEYYVFKSENNEGYSEIWVVKDSMMIARTVQDIYNNSYTEKDYNIVINSVKDEDLIVPDLEGYKVEEYINNVNAEYLELYKNIRKN